MSFALGLFVFVVASGLHAEAKIEQQEVAPTGSGIKYIVSPRGLHVATSMLKGSRSVVLMDGVSGPLFDELIWVQGRKLKAHRTMLGEQQEDMNMDPSNAPVVFNDDGSRFAYVGRQGNQFVVMLDGKEFSRGPFNSEAVQSLGFTLGGKRLCYLQTPSTPSEGLQLTHLVVEGRSEPPAAYTNAESVTFSRDGEHYAYTFGNPKGGILLVVDGKLDPPQYHAPGWVMTRNVLFTGDSKHLITVRDQTKGNLTVFVDQKPVVPAPKGGVTGVTKEEKIPVWAEFENVYVAPTGENFISQYKMPDHNTHRLFFNRTQIADSMGVNSITWSPDGKRYMAECTTDHSSALMLIDGKKGPEYRSVSPRSNHFSGSYSALGFSGDSSKSVYVGTTDKAFLVVEGEESNGYSQIHDVNVSEQSAHIGFIGTDESGKRNIIIDGKPSESWNDARDLLLSPDATHHGCVIGDQNFPTPVIDGVEQRLLLAGDFIHYSSNSAASDRHFLISPDGKHSAFLGLPPPAPTSKSDERLKHQRGFCLDGKLLPCETFGLGASAECEINPFFTPDSKHIIWIAWDGYFRASNCSVYVDGKQVGHFDCPAVSYGFAGVNGNVGAFFAQSKNAAEMRSDGTLAFLAPVGNVIKRMRLIPSNETSLANFAMVADAQQQAAQEKPKEEPTPTPSNW